MSEYNFVKYNFVKYTNRKELKQRISVYPAVSGSISTSPRFIFNSVSVKSFNLLDYKFCEVYYDAGKKALGFLFVTAEKAEDGNKNLKACFDRRNGFVAIAAAGAAKKFNLDLTKIKRCPIEVVGKMLVIIIPE